MLPALIVAACTAWHGTVVGHYSNKVSSDGTQAAETWITETPDGLAGHYVLHEEGRDVQGTLLPMGDVQDCSTALFRWHDTYGEGWLKLHF